MLDASQVAHASSQVSGCSEEVRERLEIGGEETCAVCDAEGLPSEVAVSEADASGAGPLCASGAADLRVVSQSRDARGVRPVCGLSLASRSLTRAARSRPGITEPGAAPTRAAARFLMYWFRRSTEVLGRSWVRGGLRGAVVARPVCHPRCRHGQALSSASDFERQRVLASQAVAWYEQWVRLLRRLDSGRTPMLLDLFCGGGGASEGARRVGACAVGVDSSEQPAFVARFMGESFVLGDATDREQLRYLVRRFKPLGVGASPPCEKYITGSVKSLLPGG